MAATAHDDADRAEMRRRRWAVYDNELEDSDQTISAFRRAAASSTSSARRTTAPLSLAHTSQSTSRKRPSVKSAYFFETTDDEELSCHGGAAATAAGDNGLASTGMWTGRPNTSAASMQAMAPTAAATLPRLHIGDIQFPVTRRVLWDRRVLAEPVDVPVEHVLPRFTATAAALKRVYELFRARLAAAQTSDLSRASDVLCYLCGDAASMLSDKQLVLSAVAMTQQRKDKCDPNVVWMPVYVVPEADASLQLPHAMYVSTITAAQHALGDDKSDALAPRLQPHLLVAPSRVHSAQVEFQVECCAPLLSLRFALIRSLPLLMTPLAASLAQQDFGTGPALRRNGYLTLDSTRKAVPVLRTDPLVLQRPIVGVWVYGVPLSDEWSDEAARTELADPFLYNACIGFVASRTIRERAQVSASAFLVALYPSGPVAAAATNAASRPVVTPLPRFFECSYSPDVVDVANGCTALPIERFAHHRSILVGVSSFSADVDFAVRASHCASWDRAKQQLGLPTTPSPSAAADSEQRDDSSAVAADQRESIAQTRHRGSAWEMMAQTRRSLAASAGPTTTRKPAVEAERAPMTRSRSDRSFRSDGASRSFSRVTFASPRQPATTNDDDSCADADNDDDDKVAGQSHSVVSTSDAQALESPFGATDDQPNENESPNPIRSTRADAVERSANDWDAPVRSTAKTSASALPRAFADSSDANSNSVDDPVRQGRSDAATPMRSCCKSQALLTIQHQQILENQQRQLHEMQAQIAHLRRLLRATQTLTPEERAADDLEASRASNDSASDDNSAATRLDRDIGLSGHYDGDDAPAESEAVDSDTSHYAPDGDAYETAADQRVDVIDTGGCSTTGGGNGSAEDRRQGLDVDPNGDDDGAIDTTGAMHEAAIDSASENESSLHLSSLSSASLRSDASSLSSSLVGARMKARLRASSSRANDHLDASRNSAASSKSSGSSSKSSRSSAASARSTSSRTQVHESRRRAAAEHKRARHNRRSSAESHKRDAAARSSRRVSLSAVESECKVDDDDENDDEANGSAARTVCEKMLTPDSYLKRHGALVDHHGGCFTAPSPDLHSFCVPRIKFTAAASSRGFGDGGLSDSDDEEIRLIEQKYRRLLAS